MSSHAPSSHSHSSNGFFSIAKSWLASVPITHRNAFSSTDAIARELTEATVKTTTGYIANILNPLEAVGKNALAIVSPSQYRKQGWKTAFRWAWWVISNTGKSVMNIVTWLPHAAHNIVQHGMNNTVVEASSGTLDRIPFLGKFLGNIPKLAVGALNAPFTFGSWLTKKLPDRFMDWLGKGWVYESKTRHLTGLSQPSPQGAHH